MKRVFVLTMLCLCTTILSAQTPLNEIKVNGLIVFYTGRIDLSYERKLNKNFTAGFVAGAGFKEIDFTKYRFIAKPFTRYYTGSKNNFAGFFFRGH